MGKIPKSFSKIQFNRQKLLVFREIYIPRIPLSRVFGKQRRYGMSIFIDAVKSCFKKKYLTKSCFSVKLAENY